MSNAVYRTCLSGLERLREGKVRDLYAIDEGHMLMVATDRLSAFDVVLPTPVPGKGKVLTGVSEFWFDHLEGTVPDHRSDRTLDDLPLSGTERELLHGRSLCVRRLEPLPAEAIVRGYLAGSGWKDYRDTGGVCGIPLPSGMRIAEPLAEPLFTPSTKAQVGTHDENIDFDALVQLIGADRAEEMRAVSLELYRRATRHAAGRGVLLADTKFEFGIDATGRLVLMDEVLTPDSSRFWDAEIWQPGRDQYSFDKQFVRDYLEEQDWDKRPPGPELPPEVVTRTAERYQTISRRLCGPSSTE